MKDIRHGLANKINNFNTLFEKMIKLKRKPDDKYINSVCKISKNDLKYLPDFDDYANDTTKFDALDSVIEEILKSERKVNGSEIDSESAGSHLDVILNDENSHHSNHSNEEESSKRYKRIKKCSFLDFSESD